MSGPLAETVFHDIVGQDAACEVLLSALRSERVPHAYLFAGPEGVGKSAVALRWAKALNCLQPPSAVGACGDCSACRKIDARNHPDVLWIDFEFQANLLDEPVEKQRILKIDTVREMGQILRLKPLEGRRKVAFLTPAEQLGPDAAHTILKILEEPPPQTHLVLLAGDASQLLGTIRSRCQWVRFRPLPLEALVEQLGREPGAAGQDLRAVAVQAEGSLRRAREILEGGEELGFEWETAPITELLSWCGQFHNTEPGRESAREFLRRALAKVQVEMREGRAGAADAERLLGALQSLKQNVSPQLVLETLLLRFRRERRFRVQEA